MTVGLRCAGRRVLATALAGIYFLSSAVFLHASESNLWNERQRERRLQMAALPVPRLTDLPEPVRLNPSAHLPPSLVAHLPAGFARKHAALFQSLPYSLGTVRDVVLPRGRDAGRIVVHIQDVHQNQEAQENIAAAVQSLVDAKAAGLIALEGAFAPVDLSRYRAFPDKAIVRKTADYLLRRHKISGPVHAAFTSPSEIPPLIGVDDPAHHAANVAAYVGAAPRAAGARVRLAERAAALERRKQTVFNPALKDFDRAVSDYRAGALSLGGYVSALARSVPSLPPSVRDFKAALDMEASLDFKKVEAERARLIEGLTRTLSRHQLDDLARRSLAYRAGRIGTGDFYRSLRALCEASAVPLSRYPAMDAYVRYALLADRIQAGKLFEDVSSLEKSGYAALARSPEEKALVAESTQAHLASKLVDFALTPEEWAAYAAGPEEKDLAPFEAFYKEAQARDEAMTANLLAAMKARGSDTAVLVTGGYHSPGMDARLSDAGVTVLSFTPKIEKLDTAQGSSYLDVFTREKTPLEKLFQGQKLFLASEPFSDPAATGAVLAHLEAAQPSVPYDVDGTASRTAVALNPAVTAARTRDGEDGPRVTLERSGASVEMRYPLQGGEIDQDPVPLSRGSLRFPAWALRAWSALRSGTLRRAPFSLGIVIGGRVYGPDERPALTPRQRDLLSRMEEGVSRAMKAVPAEERAAAAHGGLARMPALRDLDNPPASVFFSVSQRRPVVLLDLMERRLASLDAEKQERFISFQTEFLIHDYGHLAELNGGLRLKDGAADGLHREKEALLRTLPASFRGSDDIESDLSAEFYRMSLPAAGRDLSIVFTSIAHGLWLNDAVQRDYAEPETLILLARNLVLWGELGEFALSERVMDHARRSGLTAAGEKSVAAWTAYIQRYWDALEYDPSWAAKSELGRLPRALAAAAALSVIGCGLGEEVKTRVSGAVDPFGDYTPGALKNPVAPTRLEFLASGPEALALASEAPPGSVRWEPGPEGEVNVFLSQESAGAKVIFAVTHPAEAGVSQHRVSFNFRNDGGADVVTVVQKDTSDKNYTFVTDGDKFKNPRPLPLGQFVSIDMDLSERAKLPSVGDGFNGEHLKKVFVQIEESAGEGGFTVQGLVRMNAAPASLAEGWAMSSVVPMKATSFKDGSASASLSVMKEGQPRAGALRLDYELRSSGFTGASLSFEPGALKGEAALDFSMGFAPAAEAVVPGGHGRFIARVSSADNAYDYLIILPGEESGVSLDLSKLPFPASAITGLHVMAFHNMSPSKGTMILGFAMPASEGLLAPSRLRNLLEGPLPLLLLFLGAGAALGRVIRRARPLLPRWAFAALVLFWSAPSMAAVPGVGVAGTPGLPFFLLAGGLFTVLAAVMSAPGPDRNAAPERRPWKEMRADPRHQQQVLTRIRGELLSLIGRLELLSAEARESQDAAEIHHRQLSFVRSLTSLYRDIGVEIPEKMDFSYYQESLKTLRIERDRIYDQLEKAASEGGDRTLLPGLNLDALTVQEQLLKTQIHVAGMFLMERAKVHGGAARAAAAAVLQGAMTSAFGLRNELDFRIQRREAQAKREQFETRDWIGMSVRTVRLQGFDVKILPAPDEGEPAIKVRQQRWINVQTTLQQLERDAKAGRIARAKEGAALLGEFADAAPLLSALDKLTEGRPSTSFQLLPVKAASHVLGAGIRPAKRRVWREVDYAGLEKYLSSQIKTLAQCELDYMTILRHAVDLSHYRHLLEGSRTWGLSARNKRIISKGLEETNQWLARGFVYPKQRAVIDAGPALQAVNAGDIAQADAHLAKTAGELQQRLRELELIQARIRGRGADLFTEYMDKDILRRAREIQSLASLLNWDEAFAGLKELRELYFSEVPREPGYLRAERLLRKMTAVLEGAGDAKKPAAATRVWESLELLKMDIQNKASHRILLIARGQGEYRYVPPAQTLHALLTSLDENPEKAPVLMNEHPIRAGPARRNLRLRDGDKVLVVRGLRPAAGETPFDVRIVVDGKERIFSVSADTVNRKAGDLRATDEEDSQTRFEMIRDNAGLSEEDLKKATAERVVMMPLDRLVMARAKLRNPWTVVKFLMEGKEAFLEGLKRHPPIVVKWNDGWNEHLFISEGNHRAVAASLLGLSAMPARVIAITDSDAAHRFERSIRPHIKHNGQPSLRQGRDMFLTWLKEQSIRRSPRRPAPSMIVHWMILAVTGDTPRGRELAGTWGPVGLLFFEMPFLLALSSSLHQWAGFWGGTAAMSVFLILFAGLHLVLRALSGAEDESPFRIWALFMVAFPLYAFVQAPMSIMAGAALLWHFTVDFGFDIYFFISDFWRLTYRLPGGEASAADALATEDRQVRRLLQGYVGLIRDGKSMFLNRQRTGLDRWASFVQTFPKPISEPLLKDRALLGKFVESFYTLHQMATRRTGDTYGAAEETVQEMWRILDEGEPLVSATGPRPAGKARDDDFRALGVEPTSTLAAARRAFGKRLNALETELHGHRVGTPENARVAQAVKDLTEAWLRIRENFDGSSRGHAGWPNEVYTPVLQKSLSEGNFRAVDAWMAPVDLWHDGGDFVAGQRMFPTQLAALRRAVSRLPQAEQMSLLEDGAVLLFIPGLDAAVSEELRRRHPQRAFPGNGSGSHYGLHRPQYYFDGAMLENPEELARHLLHEILERRAVLEGLRAAKALPSDGVVPPAGSPERARMDPLIDRLAEEAHDQLRRAEMKAGSGPAAGRKKALSVLLLLLSGAGLHDLLNIKSAMAAPAHVVAAAGAGSAFLPWVAPALVLLLMAAVLRFIRSWRAAPGREAEAPSTEAGEESRKEAGTQELLPLAESLGLNDWIGDRPLEGRAALAYVVSRAELPRVRRMARQFRDVQRDAPESALRLLLVAGEEGIEDELSALSGDGAAVEFLRDVRPSAVLGSDFVRGLDGALRTAAPGVMRMAVTASPGLPWDRNLPAAELNALGVAALRDFLDKILQNLAPPAPADFQKVMEALAAIAKHA